MHTNCHSISGDVSCILKDTKTIIQNDNNYRNFIRIKRMILSEEPLPTIPLTHVERAATTSSHTQSHTHTHIHTCNNNASTTSSQLSPISYFGFTKYIPTSIKKPELKTILLQPQNKSNSHNNTSSSYYHNNNSNNNNNNNKHNNTAKLPFFTTKHRTLINIPRSQRSLTANTQSSRFVNYDLFVNDIACMNLKYDESRIYNVNRNAEIAELISQKINYFIKNENENQTTFLMKDIQTKHLNLSIKLFPMKITFNEVNEHGETMKTPFYMFNFPLSLLPVFYYKGIDNFKLILTKIINFSNDYSSITLNESALYEYLKSQAQRDKYKQTLKTFKLNNLFTNGNNNSNSNNMFKLFHAATTSSSHKRNSKKRLSNAYNMNIPLHNIKTIHIYNTSSSSSASTTSTTAKQQHLLSRGYKIVFIWTTPYKQYHVVIETPKVVLIEKDIHLSIEQYIDGYMLFYLYESNFLNWDFYLMNYLFSFKKCRNIIDAIVSKSNHKDHYANMKCECKAPFVVLPHHKYKHNMYDFISTNEPCINTYNYITSLDLKVTLCKYENMPSDYKYEYVIHFNLQQTIKIMKGLKGFPQEKIASYLVKFTEIKERELKFNYELFDSISDKAWINMLHDILKFSITCKETEVTEKALDVVGVRKVKMINRMVVDVDGVEAVENWVGKAGELEKIRSVSCFELFKDELVGKDVEEWAKVCCGMLKKEGEKVGVVRGNNKKHQTVIENSNCMDLYRNMMFVNKRGGRRRTFKG